ncbi:MAG: hypothetical protein KBD26_02635 [Candidatus Pacebacteria bacterium]|mgnify:CR=1 FL=1|nr:hypothetical protein [Candidatus Paceibacterota bacterium]MBP9772707.1 hypothetical protein [Candidatus Paceibacterota bacterium]
MKIRIEECIDPSFLGIKIFNSDPLKISFFEKEIVPRFIVVDEVEELSLRSDDEIVVELKSRKYNTETTRAILISKLTEAFDRKIEFEYKKVDTIDYL